MGYLDSAGLSHFWGKVQAALAGKQNAIAAGDGLSKTGDTLSISNPNRGILTQAEYDSMTDAQKSRGTYFVDDGSGGGGSGSSKEVYSTNETKIGTWFGKPLYRLGIKITGVHVSETPESTKIMTLSDECKLVRASGNYVFRNSDFENIYSFPFCEYDSGSIRYVSLMSYNNSIMLKTKLYNGWTIDLEIILEYTKTTDEGGAA